MGTPLATWAFAAVVLFWATGAYNRLIRLRAQSIAAYAELDLQLLQYDALVQVLFPQTGLDPLPAVQGVQSAAEQFEQSRKAALADPLDPQNLGALATAYKTLLVSWVKTCNEPPDLAGARLPESMYQQWSAIGLACESARLEFNRCVDQYNQAIRQWPARILAWVFGLRPARTLEIVN